MSLGEFIQHTPEKSPINGVVLNGRAARRTPEQEWQDKVFKYAPELGADWLEATGGDDITIEEYQRLFEARSELRDTSYATYSPSDILGVFEDWNDYIAFAVIELANRPKNKAAEDKRLIKQIHQEYREGSVPGELFCATISYNAKNPLPEGPALPRIALWEDSPVEPEVLIKRYYTYRLARNVALTHPRLDGIGAVLPEDDTELISLAMGFDLETGEMIDDPLVRLRESRAKITSLEVQSAIDDLGADYLFHPHSREKHLNKLVEIGRKKPRIYTPRDVAPPKKTKPNYYYDLDKKKLVILGELPDPDPSNERAGRHLKKLDLEGRLFLGNMSIRKYLADLDASPKNRVPTLRHVLTKDSPTRKMRALGVKSEMSAEDVLDYGHFLLSVIEADLINKDVIIRARRLEIGPGVDVVARRSGSLRAFYRSLGVVKKNPNGSFHDFDRKEFVEYIREVAKLHDGKISYRILKNYAEAQKRQGRIVPNVRIITDKAGLLTELVEEAGAITAPNHAPEEERVEKYIQAGLTHMRNHEGEVPTKRIFARHTEYGLPAASTAYLVFGGIKNYQQILLERYEGSLEEIIA